MSVAYHNRTPKSGSDYAYCGSVLELAERSDFLIVSAPGGEATRHLVGAAELEAIGPDGFLVNVGRGSIVDTQALVEALRLRRVAGAALDVIDGEPEVPAGLLALPHVVLTPHIAGRSAQAHEASLRRTIEVLDAHFAAHAVPVATGRSE
jgi:lactate dehydrogenase-like 2-hydroxyacid dehydrogenase